jgi:F-type H+-transporting ATPase subunit epsilon
MPGHEPMLSLLVDGLVRIEPVDGDRVVVAVHGGFAAMDTDNVRILAETAELASDIDVDRAKKALDRARAAGEDSPEVLAAAHRAETRLKAAAAVTASGLHN